MTSLNTITKEIMVQMPPDTRFREEDRQVIIKHRDSLLGLEEKVVHGFYDTLMVHPPTKAIFREGERAAREETLRQWWQRTLAGSFDENYWTWQALVGLIHVKRKVKNVMMISMWGWILTTLRNELQGNIPDDDLKRVMEALERLAATVQALTAESYLEHYVTALRKATGFESGLLDRMVEAEVEDLVREAG